MAGFPTDWLAAGARTHPRRLAVADPRETLTYAELHGRAVGLARVLQNAGAGPGDPVAIDLPAGGDHAVALHAAFLTGAVAQSLPAADRTEAPTAPGALVVGSEQVARAREIGAGGWEGPPRRPRDPLTRVLTSGSSGEPKPVELTAANHLWSAMASAANLGVRPDDAWLCPLPLNHVGGLSILIRSAIYGTAAVIHDGFDVDAVAEAFASGRATLASLVPTQLVRLLDAGAAIERPRLLLVGGGPLPVDVLAEALARGATVVQSYGLTEACSQVATLAPEEARERAGSAGRPLLGVEVRTADAEIHVRGPIVAPGAAAADGWLHTGDLGRVDRDGYLWVEGRRGDLIVTGGENVRPERVEEVLAAHPDVAEVAVAGAEDREWGQAVVAFYEPRPGSAPDEEELRAFARERLARHEVPKRFRRVAELPRTASGKLRRRALIER